MQLNPRRALELIHLPLKFIRVITDPVVDSILFLSSKAALPLLTSLSHTVKQSTLSCIANFMGQDRADQFSEFSIAIVSVPGLPGFMSADVQCSTVALQKPHRRLWNMSLPPQPLRPR